jgi:uncharacterized protein (UPF0332 family)
MISPNIKVLVEQRLEQSEESLEASRVLLEKGMLRPSINRSYYAMFYAVQALLAIKKKETSKHSGIISLFDKEFIKPEIFKKDFSRWLHEAFDLRQIADYSAQSSFSLEDAQLLLHHAGEFVREIKVFMKENLMMDASLPQNGL